MRTLIEVLNHPADSFRRGPRAVSAGLVALTVLINAVLEPVLQHFCGVAKQDIVISKMFIIAGFGVLSYLLITIAIWGICRCLGSKVSLESHVRAWGISYVPTALCAIVVAITEVFFQVFWNSTIWGMLLNVIFGGILIWKAILFVIYLREFALLKGWRFWVAGFVLAIIILLLAALNGYVGMKTPVL